MDILEWEWIDMVNRVASVGPKDPPRFVILRELIPSYITIALYSVVLVIDASHLDS